MRNLTLAIFSALSAFECSVAKSFAESLPTPLVRIEQTYSKKKTLQADFTQRAWNEALEQERISSGKIAYETPSKFRWEVVNPEASLIVASGKMLTLYRPGLTAKDPAEIERRNLAGDQWSWIEKLLSCRWSAIAGLKVKEVSDQQESFLSFDLDLGAQVRKLGIDKARIFVREDRLERLQIFYLNGNRSDITLSKMRLGESLPPGTFSIPR